MTNTLSFSSFNRRTCGSVASTGVGIKPDTPSLTDKPSDVTLSLNTGGKGTGFRVTFTIVHTAVVGSRLEIAETLTHRGDGLGTLIRTRFSA